MSDKSGYECGRRSMRKLLMCSSREREGGVESGRVCKK